MTEKEKNKQIKEKKDRIFTFSGIKKELKRIRWAPKEVLAESTVQVILFSALFIAYFMLCDLGIGILVNSPA